MCPNINAYNDSIACITINGHIDGLIHTDPWNNSLMPSSEFLSHGHMNFSLAFRCFHGVSRIILVSIPKLRYKGYPVKNFATFVIMKWQKLMQDRTALAVWEHVTHYRTTVRCKLHQTIIQWHQLESKFVYLRVCDANTRRCCSVDIRGI